MERHKGLYNQSCVLLLGSTLEVDSAEMDAEAAGELHPTAFRHTREANKSAKPGFQH